MRAYKPKDDVQKKAYYNDRFYVAPQLAKEEVANDEWFSKVVEAVEKEYAVNEKYIQAGQLVMFINPSDNHGVLELLRDTCGYDMLSEMSAVDFVAKRGGFEVFYQMLNLSKASRLRVKMFVEVGQAVESVQDLFRSADWSEREMYDMFGIALNNHPFPKRILMPDDWQGHPLLKTYPLQGDEAAQWYEVDKIFGKEYRDVIGPEIRDPAQISRYDTERFARLGHEVPFGMDINEGEPDTPLGYQEDDGVFLIETFDEKKSKVITDRDR
jgi:NADH-quinone oxidoreductase subunit C